MKIVSIRDKRVKALVENPALTSVRGLSPFETRRIVEMLAVLQVMSHPFELYAFPHWKAHGMKHSLTGKWSMTVKGKSILTFWVDIPEQEVSVLDYEDRG